TVRDGLMRASALSISRRFLHPSWNLRMGRRRLAGNLKLADANPAVRRRFWVNGYQIGQVNALQRNRSFRMLGDEPLLAELAGLTACFADLFHARVIQVKIENARRGHGEIWIGGARTREALE